MLTTVVEVGRGAHPSRVVPIQSAVVVRSRAVWFLIENTVVEEGGA